MIDWSCTKIHTKTFV